MRNTNRSLLSNRLLTWYARTHASLPQCSIDFPSILLSITARTKAAAAPSSRATQAFFPLKRRELWRECGWGFHFTNPETRIASEEKTPRWLCSCHLCSWETFVSINETTFPIAKCYFSNKIEEEVVDSRRGEGEGEKGQDRLSIHFSTSSLFRQFSRTWLFVDEQYVDSRRRHPSEERK